MYWHRTPSWLTWLYPQLVWHKDRSQPALYLTFDDGPVPEVTPWVLDVLDQYQAKASFFCVGENVEKHPGLYQTLLARGHVVGNHTHNHLNGWETPAAAYLNNVHTCQRQLDRYHQSEVKLMRPPYGRIKRNQIRVLQPEFQVVMWDVLTGDFDQRLDPKSCLEASIKATKKGSIVIFHDSVKAWKNLNHVLPRFLQHFSQLGYVFPTL